MKHDIWCYQAWHLSPVELTLYGLLTVIKLHIYPLYFVWFVNSHQASHLSSIELTLYDLETAHNFHNSIVPRCPIIYLFSDSGVPTKDYLIEIGSLNNYIVLIVLVTSFSSLHQAWCFHGCSRWFLSQSFEFDPWKKNSSISPFFL